MNSDKKNFSADTQFFGADAQFFTYFAYTKRESADTQFSTAVMPFFVGVVIFKGFLTRLFVQMPHII